MKLLPKTKYSFAQSISFAILLLLAINVGAQNIPGGLAYGVMPPSPDEKFRSAANYLIGIAVLVGILLVPLIGVRWYLGKGGKKKLVYILAAIAIFVIFVKLIAGFVINLGD